MTLLSLKYVEYMYGWNVISVITGKRKLEYSSWANGSRIIVTRKESVLKQCYIAFPPNLSVVGYCWITHSGWGRKFRFSLFFITLSIFFSRKITACFGSLLHLKLSTEYWFIAAHKLCCNSVKFLKLFWFLWYLKKKYAFLPEYTNWCILLYLERL